MLQEQPYGLTFSTIKEIDNEHKITKYVNVNSDLVVDANLGVFLMHHDGYLQDIRIPVLGNCGKMHRRLMLLRFKCPCRRRE